MFSINDSFGQLITMAFSVDFWNKNWGILVQYYGFYSKGIAKKPYDIIKTFESFHLL